MAFFLEVMFDFSGVIYRAIFAREYSPKGVHTAHVIDTDFTKKWTKDMSAEATIAPI